MFQHLKRLRRKCAVFFFGQKEIANLTHLFTDEFANIFLLGWISTKFTLVKNTGGGSSVSLTYSILERLHIILLYFFSVFVLVFEYGRKAIRSLKPVKVGASPT